MLAGGGYTGFEHFLYRIEIATPDGAGNARFKFSRFNGGLVGRGVFDTAVNEILIRANDQMINLSQLTDFYLEVLAPGPADDPGRWRIVMTADASLIADGRLDLANIQGAWPGLPTDEAFFRLWDGIRLVSAFPTGLPEPNPLEQGIRLEFDPPAADLGNYRPGRLLDLPGARRRRRFRSGNLAQQRAAPGRGASPGAARRAELGCAARSPTWWARRRSMIAARCSRR